jgi:outer membrane protein OmpA-like peptidoglycan-associated protein
MPHGKCSEASRYFREYLLLNTTDSRVKRLTLACDSVHWFFEDTLSYKISVPNFNKGFEANFSPQFYKEGIVFLSDRTAPGKSKIRSPYTGKEYLDIFFSRPIDTTGKWLEPELLKGTVNGTFDEGPLCFDRGFKEMYFTRNDYDGKQIETNDKNVNLLKIYYAVIEGNSWKVAGEVPFNSKDYSVGHPALSADGETLYFVSDMPWGYGGTDIYSITIKDNEWGEPINLGGKVNTEGDEMFPFIAADGILYFASDGHVGMGGLDIYQSTFTPMGWSRPENLQVPVNSSKDDFGFIIDSTNTIGYFATARNRNTDQLYAFRKNPPVFTLDLLVADAKTMNPVKGSKGDLYRNGIKEKTLTADAKSVFSANLSPSSAYTMEVKIPGYFKAFYAVSTAGKRKSEKFSDTLKVVKIEIRKPIPFPALSFAGKKTELTPAIKGGLDSLATLMQLNPEIQVELASHTDSKGMAADNLKISIARSDEMAFYLIGKGITANRIVSMGYGESKLLNNCRDGILCLEEDHRINNRVEVKVVDLLK